MQLYLVTIVIDMADLRELTNVENGCVLKMMMTRIKSLI